MFSLGIQHQQQGYVSQRVIQPLANNPDQQEILKATLQRFLYRKGRVGIILLAWKHNGFRFQIWVLIGIKVAHDQIRSNAQPFPMLQATVAADIKIVRPQIGTNTVVPSNIRTADNHTPSHTRLLP